MRIVKFFEKKEHAENFRNGKILARNFTWFRGVECERKDANEGEINTGHYVYFISVNYELSDKLIDDLKKIEKEVNSLRESCPRMFIPLIIKDLMDRIFIYGVNHKEEFHLKRLNHKKIINSISFPEPGERPFIGKRTLLCPEIQSEMNRSGLIHSASRKSFGTIAFTICFSKIDAEKDENKFIESSILHKPNFLEKYPSFIVINDHEIINKIFQSTFNENKNNSCSLSFEIKEGSVKYIDDPYLESHPPREEYFFIKDTSFKHEQEYRVSAFLDRHYALGIKFLKEINIMIDVPEDIRKEWFNNIKIKSTKDVVEETAIRKSERN